MLKFKDGLPFCFSLFTQKEVNAFYLLHIPYKL